MLILITNDDGIEAKGLRTLHSGLSKKWETVVVAPAQEQSATSHSMTLNRSLRYRDLGGNVFSVEGTPTDCVMFAVYSLLPRKPDLVVSGINHGANLADDVTYSGTVAAAIEGTLLGIPSVAISVPKKGNPTFDRHNIFDDAARFSGQLVSRILKEGMPEETLLNVNVPNCSWDEIDGVRITRLGKRIYRDVIERERGSDGQSYFRIGGNAPDWEGSEDSDVSVIDRNMISITPLRLDLTNYEAMEHLRKWEF
ncbi:MAG: 5'/3'-nucleotidase SurE [Gemmatimonadota bacterium]|nr:MAG: 5'/3'-nucleotidase SurE [Gemmatimonadota bacterium]